MQTQFKKSLGVIELTVYGLNFMIPLAPAIVFGLIAHTSGGSVFWPYLIGLIGMAFTVFSFIYMSRSINSSGSVYSYVSHGLTAKLGFIAGWMMIIDYLLSPAITTASAVLYIKEAFPVTNYILVTFLFILITAIIAILGIKLVARLGVIIFILGELTVLVSLTIWGHHAISNGGVSVLTQSYPFHYTSFGALLSASALAVMGYFGFDAIATLSEEAKKPKRDIPLAMILALIIGGVTMCLTGYFGVLAQPDNSVYQNDSWINAALFMLNQEVSGVFFSNVYLSVFIVSMATLNIFAVSSVSRIVYVMARDNRLPKIFGKLSDKFNTPYLNIIFFSLVEFLLAISLKLEILGDLISYGALFAFTLLNIAVFKLLWIKANKALSIIPILGVIVLVAILVNMDKITLTVGTSWLVLGIIIVLLPRKKLNDD